MPLGEPPAPATLVALPRHQLGGTLLHRIVRRERRTPWWFGSLGDGPGGRFDLPHPYGACYLATSPLAATLEAFQEFGEGRLPDVELRRRVRASVRVPRGAPPAAALAVARARGLGVTATLWAGADRRLTQRWADALFRAGWRALFHGIAHDPEGRLRAVTLFDAAGEHPPYDGEGWVVERHDLHADPALAAGLARYGITVARTDVQPVFVSLEESGLAHAPAPPPPAPPPPGPQPAGPEPAGPASEPSATPPMPHPRRRGSRPRTPR